MKRRVLCGIATALLVLTAGCFSTMGRALFPRTARLATLGPAELRLTLAWNGETVHVPAPATLPKSILGSKEYRRWERVCDSTTFSGRDENGNMVVATAWCFIRDREGVKRPVIPSVKVFSPNKILLNDTMYLSEGFPAHWTVYDANGRKTHRVSYCVVGTPEAAFLGRVTFFKPDGTGIQYMAGNPEQVVWAEWEVDSQGNPGKVTNGGRPELATAFSRGRELKEAASTNGARP